MFRIASQRCDSCTRRVESVFCFPGVSRWMLHPPMSPLTECQISISKISMTTMNAMYPVCMNAAVKTGTRAARAGRDGGNARRAPAICWSTVHSAATIATTQPQLITTTYNATKKYISSKASDCRFFTFLISTDKHVSLLDFSASYSATPLQ